MKLISSQPRSDGLL